MTPLETLLMAVRGDDAEPVLVQTDLEADQVVLTLDDNTRLIFDRVELLTAAGGRRDNHWTAGQERAA